MPKLIACVAGLVALIAGIFGNVDPILCLERAIVALVSGWCGGALWQAITSVPVQLTVVANPSLDDSAQKETSDEQQSNAA